MTNDYRKGHAYRMRTDANYRRTREEAFNETFLGRSLKALSSADRFELMLHILDGEKATFNEMLEIYEMTNGNLSHHLNQLKKAGLIKQRGLLTDRRSHYYLPTFYGRKLIDTLFKLNNLPTKSDIVENNGT